MRVNSVGSVYLPKISNKFHQAVKGTAFQSDTFSKSPSFGADIRIDFESLEKVKNKDAKLIIFSAMDRAKDKYKDSGTDNMIITMEAAVVGNDFLSKLLNDRLYGIYNTCTYKDQEVARQEILSTLKEKYPDGEYPKDVQWNINGLENKNPKHMARLGHKFKCCVLPFPLKDLEGYLPEEQDKTIKSAIEMLTSPYFGPNPN